MILDQLPKIKTVRWIFGDQLNARHSWYAEKCEETLYVIGELPQEINYVRHHVQKVCAFFLAMEAFSKSLQSRGHKVLYLTLDDSIKFGSLQKLIKVIITRTSCSSFEYQRPDEYRLLSQLHELTSQVSITMKEVDSEHFLVPFEELPSYFKPSTSVRMEMFYRKMRKRLTF